MAELVIKVSDEVWDKAKEYGHLDICGIELSEIVMNCVPLPKGHGRLIDADVFEKRLMNASLYYMGEKADVYDLRFAAGLDSAAERLVYAPTIIEAESKE